ncbi:hypothetical protein SAMN05660199_00325 [Klenkia soli]|uniref:Uncharacterized protein n=1 Tax=Klenkia soli TaxID=1052260 RepID=A0A1H0CJA3_9ACTN|nr:hypothetical protein [Klenkia soli]SDN57959.1 hypothetical protein SAMN05660199_00325 [Klenkia soli]
MDDGDTFRVPPVPLASGRRLPDPDGRAVAAVELVVTTEDGATTRIPLRAEHGAWWPPHPQG